MSSAPSLTPPEPVGDGAAAQPDNSLLTRSTVTSQASSSGAGGGATLGEAIVQRILQAGSTYALWEELGDDGAPPRLAVLVSACFTCENSPSRKHTCTRILAE